MNSIARLIALGCFALGGIALAICLAVSAPASSGEEAQHEPASRSIPPSTPVVAVELTPKEENAPEASVAKPDDDNKSPEPSEAVSRKLQQPAASAPVPAHLPPQSAATPPHPTPFFVALQPAFAQQPPPASPPDAGLMKKIAELESRMQDASKLGSQLPKLPGLDLQGIVNSALATDAPEEKPATPSPPRAPRNQIIRNEGEGDNNLTIHIQDTDIREVLDMLSEQGGLNILASNSVQGRVSAALNGVDIDRALAAILKSTGFVARHEGNFIFVGTPADVVLMEQSVDNIGTRVYRPNYIRALDLQTLIVPLLTQGVGTVSVTSPAQIGIAADTAQTGGNGFAGGEAVLVRDYEAVLAQVDQVFQEIDQRPQQVAIEAMILSVKIDDKLSLGVDFNLLRDQRHIAMATGAPLSDLGQVSFKDGGLKFGFLDSNLGAFVNALETIGDTNIIATPRLMCMNKHRAEILIGEKLGYLSTTQTATSTTQSVEFLEVGTQLRLRPFISPDGLIRMEVHPELSTGSVDVEGAFTLPNKVVTEVTTNIMVRDGATVIIGGLMRENLLKTASQVPFLGSAPGIGWLFRSKTETTLRDELIILITPKIVCDFDSAVEGERGAGEFHRRQAVYADKMSPLGTRYLSRKYLRLAQDTWATGDKQEAMRFVNLAIHFNPINRAAIDLRSDIMAGFHGGDHSGGPHAQAGAAAGPAMPPYAATDGDGPPLPGPYPMPGSAVEHGQTGRIRNIARPGNFR